MSTHSPGGEATHQGAEATSQRPGTALNHVEAIKPLVGSMAPPPGIAAGGWSGGCCDAKRQPCTGVSAGKAHSHPQSRPRPRPAPWCRTQSSAVRQREGLPGSARPQRRTSADDTPSKRRFQCTQAAHLRSSDRAGTGQGRGCSPPQDTPYACAHPRACPLPTAHLGAGWVPLCSRLQVPRRPKKASIASLLRPQPRAARPRTRRKRLMGLIGHSLKNQPVCGLRVRYADNHKHGAQCKSGLPCPPLPSHGHLGGSFPKRSGWPLA